MIEKRKIPKREGENKYDVRTKVKGMIKKGKMERKKEET